MIRYVSSELHCFWSWEDSDFFSIYLLPPTCNRGRKGQLGAVSIRLLAVWMWIENITYGSTGPQCKVCHVAALPDRRK
jgi:hypothetical protein